MKGLRQLVKWSKLGCLIILLTACRPEGSEVDATVASINEYFDVQGLLAENVARLRKIDVLLHKKAIFGGAEEQTTLKMDSAALANEFEVFREVDINRPVLSGRYYKEEELVGGKEVITYVADDQEVLNIKYLKIFKNPATGEVEHLDALFSSKNILYNSTRRLSMQYGAVNNQHLPIYYQVEGSQKMIFNDKEDYHIKAEFQYP